MAMNNELQAKQLYQQTDLEQFDFRTTADLEDLVEVLGQPRATAAMQFGMGMPRDGYNIFALGPTGTGKRRIIRSSFEKRAVDEAVPDDWCYVNNFDERHKPKTIRLPAGTGIAFRDDMDELIEGLNTALSAAFESEEYQARRQTINEEFQEQQSQAFEEIQEKAEEKGLALLRTPAGLVFAPVKDGQVLSSEEVQGLSEEERQRLESEVEELQSELQKSVQQMPGLQRETQEKLKELNREIANFAVGGLIDELRDKYSDHLEVVDHLDAVQKDIVENARDFLQTGEERSNLPAMLRAASQDSEEGSPLARRYRVNLLVDHSQSEGAPVVYEDNPTYQNLVGRVEHRAQMGALLTDFNLIKPGALHKANGGYLILDVRKVLLQPYAWEALKRTLQAGEIRIESLGQMLSIVSTISLEPDPIPLDVKIALYGEPLLYYLLYQLDPEFAELFKVEVDFDERMDRNSDNQEAYARLIATLIRQEELQPFDRAAVGRIIERSSRLVGDAKKLSTQTRDIANLLREADYWAREAGNDTVMAEDVQQAIEAQIYRADRIRERMQETIQRDIVLIDTEGEEVGQVNGLSVIMLGNFAFGRPSRITARTRLGKGDVVDIEREVELGGPIHSKGVLILAGFLGARYAGEQPLSLSASLVFEQSYAGVDGDSASSAELYALLSAISEVPLRQSFAVTGSVNQHGVVQAIGGVNEKIEGFFDVCQARGLTGEQGVLIPASNVQHLMLRQDVVDAVDAGQFHIYPVETVDQGIEILTGLPAGEPDEDGEYPENSVNFLVKEQLTKLAEQRQAFGTSEKEVAA
ncbi:MAG: ATP-binding protein [Chloroflexota bacterium]|jgi:lon-related putative ATP-dependent protease